MLRKIKFLIRNSGTQEKIAGITRAVKARPRLSWKLNFPEFLSSRFNSGLRVWDLLALFFVGAAAANADGEIGCSLAVTSPYKLFQERMETSVRAALNADPAFDLHPEKTLGGHRDFIHLELSYPVMIFPGKASFYARWRGQTLPLRTLCLSHLVEADADPGDEEQAELLRQALPLLLAQIKVEAGLLSGNALMPGEFANNRDLNLPSRHLKVELVAPRGGEPSPPEAAPAYRSASLRQEQRRADQEPHEDWRTHLGHLQGAPRYDYLRYRLDRTWRTSERSLILRELARMYEEIADTERAHQYAEEAVKADPADRRSLEFKHRLAGPLDTPVGRLRQANRNRRMRMGFRLGTEWDDNVIQESVNPLFQSEQTDVAFSLSGVVAKRWGREASPFGQETSFEPSMAHYTIHRELNLATQRLGHEFTYTFDQPRGFTRLHLRAAGSHSTRQAWSLLRTEGGSGGASWFSEPLALLAMADLSYTRVTYFQRFFDKNALDGDRVRGELSLLRFLDARREGNARLVLSRGAERPQDATLRYTENAYKLAADLPVPGFLSSAGFSLGWLSRSHARAERGRTPREDHRGEAGVTLRKVAFENLTFELGYTYTDNRSNRAVNTFQREQVALGYTLNL